MYRGGYLNNPKPIYPPLSIEMEETGTVRLRVQVSAQGLPLAVELEQTSGFPRLDRAALTAVRGWNSSQPSVVTRPFLIPLLSLFNFP